MRITAAVLLILLVGYGFFIAFASEGDGSSLSVSKGDQVALDEGVGPDENQGSMAADVSAEAGSRRGRRGRVWPERWTPPKVEVVEAVDESLPLRGERDDRGAALRRSTPLMLRGETRAAGIDQASSMWARWPGLVQASESEDSS